MGPDWSFERMTSSWRRHLRGRGSSFGSGGNSTTALGDNSVVLSLPESGGRGGMLLSKSMRSGGKEDLMDGLLSWAVEVMIFSRVFGVGWGMCAGMEKKLPGPLMLGP